MTSRFSLNVGFQTLHTHCLPFRALSSLYRALSETRNTSRIDTFFTLLSRRLLSAIPDGLADLTRCYNSTMPPVMLSLPDETRMNIDNTLSEFEAADFGDMVSDIELYNTMYNIILYYIVYCIILCQSYISNLYYFYILLNYYILWYIRSHFVIIYCIILFVIIVYYFIIYNIMPLCHYSITLY